MVAVFSAEDQIADQKTVLCCISCLLSRWSKVSQCHLGKAAHRVIDSKFDLILFSVGVWVAGSLELIVALQVVDSVAQMKCIYKLCLVYNCQEKQGVLSAKGCHLPFQQPRINV